MWGWKEGIELEKVEWPGFDVGMTADMWPRGHSHRVEETVEVLQVAELTEKGTQ